MKTLIKYLYLFIVPMVIAGALLSSCDDDELENGGEPAIYYVRITSPGVFRLIDRERFSGESRCYYGR